ncbi:MAG: dihydropteroate synthase [Lacibacter sp.]
MFTLNCKGRLFMLETPAVMGIINCTPDSFYAGSRVTTTGQLLQQAEAMLAAGARILDIGGQSTRPGSEKVDAVTEANRVVPFIARVKETFPDAFVSVDTFYASVARAAVEAGADMVNDISAGTLDAQMLPTVAALRVPYIAMHMKGTPQTMQQQAQYNDVVTEVLQWLLQKIQQCREAGIVDVIVDPGFGFAKTAAHNFRLLRELKAFSMLGCPVLAGLSRKSTIYKTLGCTADEALNGTTVLNTVALLNGASLLRVHDVKEAVEAVQLVEAVKNA